MELDAPTFPADDDRPNPRRRQVMLALAVAPWLLVLVLLLRPGVAEEPAPSATDAPNTTTAPATSAAPATGAAPATSTAPHQQRDQPELPAADAPAAPTPATTSASLHRVANDAEARALALQLARDRLTTVGPSLDPAWRGPVEDRYAEHLAVGAVERTSAETLVVSVVAVVLNDAGSDPWASMEHLAIPLALTGDGPRPAGEPWSLPPPTSEPVTPELHAIEDDQLRAAASTALAAEDVGALTELASAPGWPLVATVETHDGGREQRWLIEADGELRLAGTSEPADAAR